MKFSVFLCPEEDVFVYVVKIEIFRYFMIKDPYLAIIKRSDRYVMYRAKEKEETKKNMMKAYNFTKNVSQCEIVLS